MRYDKEEYEKLILESPLFSLDRELQRSLYQREALKMVEYLYCYLMAINEYKYEPYGVEMVDTAKRCIENYKPEAGRFLNYFNAAWKTTYGHLRGKELVKETFKGIHFTDEEERVFRKYMKLAQSIGLNTESSEFEQKVAEAMGLSVDEIQELRWLINSKPIAGSYINDEGEEYSLIDQIDSKMYVDSELQEFEKAEEFLAMIQTVFDQLQERQKPMMAKLITSKISYMIVGTSRLVTVLKGKSYYDAPIYEDCVKGGRVIQAKDIARQFGVTEASASRSWKIFKEKLKMEYNGRRLEWD